MTIHETIKNDLMSARKAQNKDKVSVLSTVLGEMTANAKLVDGQKVVSDDAAIAVLSKAIKGLDETISYVADPIKKQDLVDEKNIITVYLPTQLSESDLREIISSMNASNLGQIMSTLKQQYPNQYDGKLASQIARELL